MSEPEKFDRPPLPVRMVTPEMNAKFLADDQDNPLSDEDLEIIEEFYTRLEQMVNILGRDFYLVKVELDRRLIKVRWQKDQRKQKLANAAFRAKMDETLKKT